MVAIKLNRRGYNLVFCVFGLASLSWNANANADDWPHLAANRPIARGSANGPIKPATSWSDESWPPTIVGDAVSDGSDFRPIGEYGEGLDQQPFESSQWPANATSTSNQNFTPETLRKLMRPSLDFAVEWQAKTEDVGLASYDASITFPTFPLFGPPPPFISVGFDYTSVDAPTALGLPTDLYQTELGFAWMRRLNEKWLTRLMAGVFFATDGENSTSDAWRFRGGVFAIYRRNPQWTWTFGALALGRNDIPVVPAAGLIWQPNPGFRIDLLMPRPRMSILLRDNGPRQQWGYLGAGLNGATWGVQRADGVDDQLTYGDFRAVVGWESTPTPEPGMPFTRGRKIGAEIGYVFSRDFEWEDDASKIRLDDSLMLRGSMSF